MTACLIGSGTLLSSSALAQNTSAQNLSGQGEATPDAQYTVQKGDTAFSISRRYNLSLEQLRDLNGLTDSSVQLGQVLTVRDSSKVSRVSRDAPRSEARPPASAPEMPLIRVQAPHLPIATLSASSESAAPQTPRIVPPAPKVTSSAAPPVKVSVRQAVDPSSNTPSYPSSYTVQKGETAYSIARRYGLRLERLLDLNGLSSAQVYPGQILRVRGEKAAPTLDATSSTPISSTPISSTPTSNTALTVRTYTVQKGDTLFSISRRFGVTVGALQEANGLSSSDLHSGLDLSVPAPLEAVQEPQDIPSDAGVSTPGESSLWRVKAMSLLGVPYVYGGKSARGTDCSGFVLQAMASSGVTLPRRSSDQYTQGDAVTREDLQAGDLVFFDTTGSGGVSHVGIYLGEGKFINANSYVEKVAVDDLNSSYWTPRYLGARRVLVNSVARAG